MNFVKMNDFLQEIVTYASQIDILELSGLIFGLLAVYYLIRENILTWPTGIIYVLISFIIFWKARLYGDFLLHIVFLILNIYGWYYWINGKKEKDEELPVTTTNWRLLLTLSFFTLIGIFLLGYILSNYTDASVPYWDSATTVMSFTGMWLTARKKIESWVFWLIVDVMATGIYIYKDIYFYALLYGVYIIMAVSGYISWKKSLEESLSIEV